MEKVNEYVRDACSEWYEIPPNFEFRGITIILPSPMAMGFKRERKKILMPFVKPCFWPMLIEVDAIEGDFDALRERLGSA